MAEVIIKITDVENGVELSAEFPDEQTDAVNIGNLTVLLLQEMVNAHSEDSKKEEGN